MTYNPLYYLGLGDPALAWYGPTLPALAWYGPTLTQALTQAQITQFLIDDITLALETLPLPGMVPRLRRHLRRHSHGSRCHGSRISETKAYLPTTGSVDLLHGSRYPCSPYSHAAHGSRCHGSRYPCSPYSHTAYATQTQAQSWFQMSWFQMSWLGL